ncbi:hypothetical protein GCM10023340_02270 [Nocardioides marinquilinus]|uniref:Uncharacterized protein n=1 Tax=Nocardioides marinquilinus TaxID=1210400 RepID=A0ABP9PBU3_9ACTN
MWVLDPANSRELLDRLRPHSAHPDFDVIWCGEGWRALVSAWHANVVEAFPDYRWRSIRSARGVLVLEAKPRAAGATAAELARVREVCDRYARASATVCEWCGRPGSLRDGRLNRVTLCNTCSGDVATTSYPRARPSA